MPRILILGTRNLKKRRELEQLLAGLKIELRTLADYPQAIDVVEDGETFAENAAKKAIQQAQHLGEWVLGEDSGICVDALDGRPGIYSARYSGADATDKSNNLLLLEELQSAASAERNAHYVCHVTLANERGEILIDLEEICRGEILSTPRGTEGFGYDPLFEIPEYRKTFAELGAAVKSALSHRGRAMRKLSAKLATLVKSETR
ncbi:MAG: RdgB/HAM1 family non-canonical purine NTP pyrophosphatase [Pirellulales bacterium]|nr:RdgB/HAM1 family non-canonical purine NTP pyrophosphatase [Pirellulales bacterium]